MNALGYPSYVIHNGYRDRNISFNSGDVDANGCYWMLDGSIEGWDSPDVRGSTLAKIGDDTTADGELLTDAHYRGRTLSFCLHAECPSEAAREAARSLISEVTDLFPFAFESQGGSFFANEETPVSLGPIFRFGNTGQGKLKLTDQAYYQKVSESQMADGTKLGGLEVGTVVWPLKAEVELYCPDPRKYAQSPVALSSSSGHIHTSMAGSTFTQRATLTLSALSGNGPYTVTVTDNLAFTQTMRLVVPTVPAGAPPLNPFPAVLVLDLLAKTILDNGGNNYYYLRDLTTPWLQIPPGTNVDITSTVANVALSVYPAWL